MNSPVHRLSAKNFYVLTSLIFSLFILKDASAQNCSGSLLQNPGFELNAQNGWEGSGGTTPSTDARSGQGAVQMAVSDYLRIWQFFPAEPGQEYTASGYIKGNSHGTIGLKFLSADYQPDNQLASKATNGEYTLIELTRTAPANAAWVEISIYSNPDEAVLVDDFCLTGGSASACQASNLIDEGACNNAGTPNDPSDDFFNVTFNSTRPQSGGAYIVDLPSIGDNQSNSYGNPIYAFGFKISDGNVAAIFNDNEDPTCQEILNIIAPATCSDGGTGMGGDLNLTATGSPATIAAWQFGSSTFTITNEGTQAVSGAEVSFDLDASAKLKGGDEYTASQGTLQSFWTQTPAWQIGNLAAGQSETIQLNIFTLSGDEMPIYGQVSAASGTDPDSSPNNGTAPNPNEDDEAVFTFNGSNTGAQPDLQLANLNIQNSFTSPGEVLSYNVDISNLGAGAANGDFKLKSYISTDQNISADDIQDGELTTGNFSAGSTVPQVLAASTIPPNLANGTYFLILKIDEDEVIAESNENNNLIFATFQVGCICPTVVDPVCGSDGVTYGNSCEAECAGIFDYSPGACQTGNSCAFITNYVPQNVPQLSPFGLRQDFFLAQTADEYIVGNSPNPSTTNQYRLDLDGNVLGNEELIFPANYDVVLEMDTDENLEMVFNFSPDVPQGTRVPIDYNYPNADGLIVGDVFKISTGYAFGITIIDQTQSPLNIQRILKTDNFGQNVEIFNMPFGDFFSGFGTLTEGSDGGIYTEWATSGNFSIYGVPPSATEAWRFGVAGDTPSTTWVDVDVSADGQFVYSAKTDNQVAVIAKINAATGIGTNLDLSALIAASGAPDPFRTNALGIEPTPDGGLLVSLGIYPFLGVNPPQAVVFGKFDADGNLLWSQNISVQSRLSFQLIPVGITSDGGAFFIGFEDRNLPSGDIETVFLKTTADGQLDPFCGTSLVGPDLELSFAPLADPDPAQWSFFPVTLTMKNNGTETVTNAEVQFTRADEVVYQGGNEYAASQGIFQIGAQKGAWFAGDLAPGEMATLTVNYFRLSANPFTAYAQVFNMDQDDVDSTPQNGDCCVANEDDEATLAIGSGAAQAVSGRSLIADNLGDEVFAILNAAPNPFSERLNLNVFSNENQSSEVVIYDVLGRPVLRQAVDLSEGHNSIEIDASDLPSGFLTVKMSPEHRYLRQVRVVKVRD